MKAGVVSIQLALALTSFVHAAEIRPEVHQYIARLPDTDPQKAVLRRYADAVQVAEGTDVSNPGAVKKAFIGLRDGSYCVFERYVVIDKTSSRAVNAKMSDLLWLIIDTPARRAAWENFVKAEDSLPFDKEPIATCG